MILAFIIAGLSFFTTHGDHTPLPESIGRPADIVSEALPDYATNCRYTIRSSRTSAVGICYNWSGSGNYKFQVAALMFDGCRRYYWAYGSVGYPYIRGKTTTGKWSYVYTPPGGWTITAAKVVVWKP